LKTSSRATAPFADGRARGRGWGPSRGPVRARGRAPV